MKEKPFSDVLIHGIVRDSQGRKMSKTLGNGVDPIEVIEQYGADSMRFSVLSGTTMGNDIRYMPEKLEQASNFANKIWNAAKFIIMNRPEEKEIIKFAQENFDGNTYKDGALKLEDKWIISKLNKLVADITKNIENYDLGVALDNIYGFIWNEFCDWYIEMVKSRLYSEDQLEKVRVSYVLDYVFRTTMKLLHPFMPFVTSEIYDNLVKYDDKELMVSDWPKENDNLNREEIIEKIKQVIVEIRNIRANKNIHPSKKSEIILVPTKNIKELTPKLKELAPILLKLGFGSKITIKENNEGVGKNTINIITEGLEVYVSLEGLIDVKEEIERLSQEKAKMESEIARCEKMLSNPGFVNKAPKAKVEEEQQKLENYKEMLSKIEIKLAEYDN